jgi:hypothetical protein
MWSNIWGTLEKVLRQENRTLKAAGDHRLARSLYDWPQNPISIGAERP